MVIFCIIGQVHVTDKQKILNLEIKLIARSRSILFRFSCARRCYPSTGHAWSKREQEHSCFWSFPSRSGSMIDSRKVATPKTSKKGQTWSTCKIEVWYILLNNHRHIMLMPMGITLAFRPHTNQQNRVMIPYGHLRVGSGRAVIGPRVSSGSGIALWCTYMYTNGRLQLYLGVLGHVGSKSDVDFVLRVSIHYRVFIHLVSILFFVQSADLSTLNNSAGRRLLVINGAMYLFTLPDPTCTDLTLFFQKLPYLDQACSLAFRHNNLCLCYHSFFNSTQTHGKLSVFSIKFWVLWEQPKRVEDYGTLPVLLDPVLCNHSSFQLQYSYSSHVSLYLQCVYRSPIKTLLDAATSRAQSNEITFLSP